MSLISFSHLAQSEIPYPNQNVQLNQQNTKVINISFFFKTIPNHYELTVQNAAKNITYLVPNTKAADVAYFVGLWRKNDIHFTLNNAPPNTYLSHADKYFYVPTILFCFASESVCHKFFKLKQFRKEDIFVSLIKTCHTLKLHCDSGNGEIEILKKKIEDCYQFVFPRSILPFVESCQKRKAYTFRVRKNPNLRLPSLKEVYPQGISFMTTHSYPQMLTNTLRMEFYNDKIAIHSDNMAVDYSYSGFEALSVKFYQSIIEKYMQGERECHYIIPREVFLIHTIGKSFYLPFIIFYLTDIDFCQKFIRNYINQSHFLNENHIKENLILTIETIAATLNNKGEELNQLKYKIELSFDRQFVTALKKFRNM